MNLPRPASKFSLYSFLFFSHSFCFCRRAQRSPRELVGVPQDAIGTLLTPTQTTVDTPLTARTVGSVYSEKKFLADRQTSPTEKKPVFLRCHHWFPREMSAVVSGY